MASQLYLKTNNQKIPANLEVVTGGFILTANGQWVELIGSRQALVDFANKIISLANPPRQRFAWPQEMQEPETGWTWLLKNRPWIFDGISLQSEPYASYLFGSESDTGTDVRLENDLEAIKHLQQPSKADIAEVLTGKRTYGGAIFERVTAAFDAFYTSTTSPEEREQEIEVFQRAA